jgi:hypothetical protein
MKGLRRIALIWIGAAVPAAAQHDHGAAARAMSGAPDSIGRLHMEMTPLRKATAADSAKAMTLVKELRTAIVKYADTAAAVRDGYRMFAPQLKTQKAFHFTKNRNAVKEAFRFDAAKPTSLLYEKDSSGKMKLVGAMYTMPKRVSADKLDGRVPLSIAQWHKHVNWCVPGKRQQARWLEKRNGLPVFGPESPIATKAECAKAGGDFHENVFGWMVHVNVFAGDDLHSIFGNHSGAHHH